MNMATKANHHYVPLFYLRGFADGIGRQAKVFVFDQKTKRSFKTLVRNVGSKRHFNRIKVKGMDQNALEDGFSEIETEIAIHLRDAIEERAFPSSDHFYSVMNLIALISVRNPRLRGTMEGFHTEIVQRMASLTFRNRAVWEAQTKKMKEDGVPVNEDLSFEDMKDFLDKGEYEILIDQTHLITLELRMIEPVLERLVRRNWTFVRASPNTQFICSDDPAVLSWKSEDRQAGFYSPGHGLSDTIVFFPVCSELLLIGMFEEMQSETTYTPDQVTAANTHIAKYCTRQIYARDGLFKVNLKDCENVLGQDLASLIP